MSSKEFLDYLDKYNTLMENHTRVYIHQVMCELLGEELSKNTEVRLFNEWKSMFPDDVYIESSWNSLRREAKERASYQLRQAASKLD